MEDVYVVPLVNLTIPVVDPAAPLATLIMLFLSNTVADELVEGD